MKCSVLFLFALLSSTLAVHLPPDFITCNRSASDFTQCLSRAVTDAITKLANGNEDFKVPPLEPVTIPKLEIDQGSGPVQVVQRFKNAKLHGLSKQNVEITKLEITDTQVSLEATIHIDMIRLEAQYELDGRILVLPIQGTGPCNVTLTDVYEYIKLVGDIFRKKGKEYLEFKSNTGHLKPKKVQFNFENLFNGDKRLGDETNKVLNENWREVFFDVEEGYASAVGQVMMSISNRIFKQCPLDEIFPK